tara:strand:- start:1301 stop:1432 length:132 start_codon:yes stop_codon:yes gene_type:complete
MNSFINIFSVALGALGPGSNPIALTYKKSSYGVSLQDSFFIAR